MHFALACSHFPENSYLLTNWQFCARFSNCSNSLNFEAKINCNTTKQNDLKWRKTCTGSKFDLVHFNGPQTKFIVDSLYKHPVHESWEYSLMIMIIIPGWARDTSYQILKTIQPSCTMNHNKPNFLLPRDCLIWLLSNFLCSSR